jgi:hypothetical protein
MSFSVRVSVVAAVMTISAAAAGPSLVRPGNAIAETATAENVVIISKGGPIRNCFQVSCDEVSFAEDGERLTSKKFATNQEGNRWYFVEQYLPAFRGGSVKAADGWIWCGNVEAPC